MPKKGEDSCLEEEGIHRTEGVFYKGVFLSKGSTY